MLQRMVTTALKPLGGFHLASWEAAQLQVMQETPVQASEPQAQDQPMDDEPVQATSQTTPTSSGSRYAGRGAREDGDYPCQMKKGPDPSGDSLDLIP